MSSEAEKKIRIRDLFKSLRPDLWFKLWRLKRGINKLFNKYHPLNYRLGMSRDIEKDRLCLEALDIQVDKIFEKMGVKISPSNKLKAKEKAQRKAWKEFYKVHGDKLEKCMKIANRDWKQWCDKYMEANK